jgi:hypothetical protein
MAPVSSLLTRLKALYSKQDGKLPFFPLTKPSHSTFTNCQVQMNRLFRPRQPLAFRYVLLV